MEVTPNILAERYASPVMRAIWSERGKAMLEREYWMAVMKAQRELGIDIPEEAIATYERVLEQIDFKAMRERERVTRHDVKARLEVFNELAGFEHVHKGLTSRDLTENVEQLQIYRALELVCFKAVAALTALGRRAEEWKELVITARTHNVAAQPTTFGRRLAMFGEDLLLATERVDQLMSRYSVRGLKGAVGTQMDMLILFEGDRAKVTQMEEKILQHLGIKQVLKNTGQVYPRSLDFEVVSALYQLTSGPSSFAKTLRLMAGHELASEGFIEGQVGSSSMPHKMNSRSCERINGFSALLRGHLMMVAGVVGDQWNEGDVSCSVVRRVVLPDSFFALDGLLETFLNVLHQMEVYPSVIERENHCYLSFLTTTTILMEAVKTGVGREIAHQVIQEHAVAVARDWRAGKITHNDLLDRLARDRRLGLTREKLQAITERKEELTGMAAKQVDTFCKEVASWQKRFPDAAEYQPQKIL